MLLNCSSPRIDFAQNVSPNRKRLSILAKSIGSHHLLGSNLPKMGGFRGHGNFVIINTDNQPPILVQRSDVDGRKVRFPTWR